MANPVIERADSSGPRLLPAASHVKRRALEEPEPMRKLISTFALIVMTATCQAQGIPPEVSRLVSAVSSVKGATSVEIDKTYLPEVNVADLSLPGAYADLPIATLRRSKGALPEEQLLSINFRIERTEAGLKALEFLSWWVRDQSRGGQNMQIRSIGLPPIAGDRKQLGSTLRFTIDWFYTSKSRSMQEMLASMGEKAKELELAVKLYGAAF